MVTLKDLNSHNYPTTKEIDDNLNILLARINLLEQEYGKQFHVTSGLRSEAQQKQLISQGRSNATKSNHLIGAAVDILDIDGKLYDWCKAHTDALESTGLWCEERMGGWQHFQIYPPKSGHRWFFP